MIYEPSSTINIHSNKEKCFLFKNNMFIESLKSVCKTMYIYNLCLSSLNSLKSCPISLYA